LSAVTSLLRQDPDLQPITTTEIAAVTVDAVGEIGTRSADQIDAAANAIEEAGRNLVGKLRSLSAAMREHSRRAAQEVSDYSLLVTTMTDTVLGLQKQITDKHT
jgi:hypothetical protein